MVKRQALLIAALVILLRLPFLNEAVQGDDVYYLYGAQQAQIDPLHPLHTHYAFLGDMVDMRGHPHGPLNPWVLGALIATFGEVREIPFHLAYLGFSLIAALSMLALARRFVPERALLATALFTAVPAFVINSNSFESDLVFLAFWLLTIATFLRALDARSLPWLAVSILASALAALDAFQAGMLLPILGLYLWLHDRKWTPAWLAICAAPATIVLWQAWEWSTSGTLPLAVLLGYMRSGELQSTARKLGSAAALTGHAAWIVFPALIVAAFYKRATKLHWIVIALVAILATRHDLNPLFWASVAIGALLVTTSIRREFLSAWILLFFTASLVIFFAGSARYLLPIAAPVAILTARELPTRWLQIGFAAQLAISLALAAANHEHWNEVRTFANQVMNQANGRRVWVDAEWGIRHYLEDRGARPLLKNTILRANDIVVRSDLGQPVAINSPTAKLLETTIAPAIPFRLISIDGGSGYSASSKGLLPFELSTEPIDRLHAEVVIEREPTLSYLDPKSPEAPLHILNGLFPDGWSLAEAQVLLKVPEHHTTLSASIFIPPDAPARTITLLADAKLIAQQAFPAPGAYTLTAPFHTDAKQLTVTLRVDKTHQVPPDTRALGVIVIGIGLQ